MLCARPDYFVYHGAEISLLKGGPEAEAFIKDFGVFNIDSNPEKLSDVEIERNHALKEIDPQKLDELLGWFYKKIEVDLHKTYYLPSQDFHRRPQEKMKRFMETGPSLRHGVQSMQDQTDQQYSLREAETLDMLSIYESLYDRRQTPGALLPDSSTLADKICMAETKLAGKDWATHFAHLCLRGNSPNCDEMKYVALLLTNRCLSTEPMQQALKIFWNYDEEIRQAANVIAGQHPELKASNIRLLLYSILILEATELKPHDIWQDVSACNWEEDEIGPCSFADQIEAILFKTPHKIYEDKGFLKELFEIGWSQCTLFEGWKFSINDCASKEGIRRYVFNSPPTWKHQLAWQMASNREETHRKKQGFGLGQIILGLALKSAGDPEAFEPFVRAGLLTPGQFAGEKAALNTILNPETYIYAKGLTLNYALTHLKRTRLKEPEAALPSDTGLFITNDTTARELALLTGAEILIRFPDENSSNFSTDVVDQMRIEHTLIGMQDEVTRLFLTAYLLGEEPDTPSLKMTLTSSMDLLESGAGYMDGWYGYFGGYEAQNLISDKAAYFHWVPTMSK